MNYDEIFQDNNFFRNVSEHEEEEEEFRFQEALRALAPNKYIYAFNWVFIDILQIVINISKDNLDHIWTN